MSMRLGKDLKYIVGYIDLVLKLWPVKIYKLKSQGMMNIHHELNLGEEWRKKVKTQERIWQKSRSGKFDRGNWK